MYSSSILVRTVATAVHPGKRTAKRLAGGIVGFSFLPTKTEEGLSGNSLFDSELYIVYICITAAVVTWGPQMASIRVKALPQEVAKRIREMIRKGILKKGDRILENPLCEAMGVSRTPLREGLRLLSSEGLIELIPNQARVVVEPSMKDIRECSGDEYLGRDMCP